ncbi:hypothetical protein [Catenulispora subtropica]|uniref:Knr4/Smi1-like domain-containing protein n=1 Tax=Catenulispora subtropica TaxID=450798 RepID=A0ABP5EQD0_9ACTN
MLPKPLDLLNEGEVARLTGADVIGCHGPGAVAYLGSDAVSIVADPVDDPEASGVRSRYSFHLQGPFVGDLGVRVLKHPPARNGPEDLRPIHLFARLPEGCLYLGAGTVGLATFANDLLYEAELDIEPPLPAEMLDRVRRPSEPGELPGLDWIEALEQDPGEALDTLVHAWFPKTSEDLGQVNHAGWTIPGFLSRFYQLARHRPAVLGVQNFINLPEHWYETADGLVAFGAENQGGFRWFFDPGQDDPEIWIDHVDGPQRERVPMSHFLVQFAMHEAMMNSHCQAWYPDLTPDEATRLRSLLTPLPWEPWRWPTDSTLFYAAPGLIVTVYEQSDGVYAARAGAVHRSVLTTLDTALAGRP